MVIVASLLLSTCSGMSPGAPEEPAPSGPTDVVSGDSSAARRPKRTTTTTTTTTTAPDLPPTTSPTTTTSPVPEPAPVIGPWRATYTPHGGVATAKSSTYIAERVRELRAAGFTDQLHNIGVFDAMGDMPAAEYAGLGAWIDTSRRQAPEQRVIAWVNGREADHVDRAATHQRIAAWVRHAVRDLGVDGVLFDFEPFTRDNPRLLDLLDAVRAQVPEAWLAIASPAERWSEPFIGEVARRVDLLSPMVYDSTLTSPAAYSDLVRRTALAYHRGAAGRATVAPSLPAYAANKWHDPSVENIATAGDGLRVAAAAGAPSGGAAVYWWWQMGPSDLESWTALIR